MSAIPLGRVVGVERDGRPVETALPIRPYDEREKPTPARLTSSPRGARKPIKKPKMDGRVEEMRARLRNLLDEGEAHNESGIFKLEREIYDLERAGDGADQNDWSAWEEGGGQ